MKLLLKSLVLSATLITASQAFATDPGFYLGINGLYGDYDAHDITSNGTTYEPESKGVYGGGVTAGYNITRRFALETGIEGLDKVTYDGEDAPTQSVMFAFLAAKPMIQGEYLVAFARIGGAYLEINQDDNNDDTDDKSTKLRPLVGLGFGMNVSPAFEIDLSANRIQDSDEPMSFAMLEFTYHFITHYSDSGFIAD